MFLAEKRKTVWFGCVSIYLSGIFLAMIGLLMVSVTAWYDLTVTQSGLYMTMNYVGYTGLITLSGFIAAKVGEKRVALVSMAALCAVGLSYFVTVYWWQAILISFGIGGFAGTLESMGQSVLSGIDREQSAFYANLGSACMTVGYLSGAILSFVFIANGIMWRGIYLLLAAVMVFIMICFSRVKLLNVKQEKRQGLKKEALVGLLSNKYYLLACVCMMFDTGLEAMLFSWLSTYFVKEAQMPYAESTFMMCIFYLSMLLGKLTNGILVKRIRPVYIAIVSSSLAFVVFTLLMHMSGTVWILVLAFSLGFIIAGLYPYIVSVSGMQSDESYTIPILMGFGGIGTIMIPGMVGFINNYFEMSTIMQGLAVLFLVMSFIFIVVFRRQEY